MNLDPAARERAVDMLPVYIRIRRPAAGLLAAIALAAAPVLLQPTVAPAREHNGRVQSNEATTTTPSESADTPSEPAANTPPAETAPSPPAESSGGTSRRHERRADQRNGCQVEISEATPNRLAAGETTTVIGSLACAEPAAAGEQTVTIHQHTTGTHGQSIAGTTTTEQNGAFRFTSGALEANSSFFASYAGTRSQRVVVRVAPLVTIAEEPAATPPSVASRPMRTSAVIPAAETFTGTVSPVEAGAKVVLQRARANGREHWHRIGVAVLGADGTYAITCDFYKAGKWIIRAVVHGRGIRASASEPLAYEVAWQQSASQGITTELSAHVSATSVRVGETLTFSGTVTPDQTGQPVYLERQVGTGVSFHVVKAGVVGTGSTFSIEDTPTKIGTQIYRIKLPGDAGGQALTSAPFTIQVTSTSGGELTTPPPGETPPT